MNSKPSTKPYHWNSRRFQFLKCHPIQPFQVIRLSWLKMSNSRSCSTSWSAMHVSMTLLEKILWAWHTASCSTALNKFTVMTHWLPACLPSKPRLVIQPVSKLHLLKGMPRPLSTLKATNMVGEALVVNLSTYKFTSRRNHNRDRGLDHSRLTVVCMQMALRWRITFS